MRKLTEAKYDLAEVVLYFKDFKEREEAFKIFLGHHEDVYKFDEHYNPFYPGSDRKKASERALVIYAEIFEDVKKEVPEFVEDMESLLPFKVLEFQYRPVADSLKEKKSLRESKIADAYIICEEVLSKNPRALPEDLAESLVEEMGISLDNAMSFATDYLKGLEDPEGLKESRRERTVEVDFPITVNDKGRIKANDAKKLLKDLNSRGLLRSGRTYFVKDSLGNETCWDLKKDTFGGFTFDCEIVDDDRDFYNSLYFYKGKKGMTDFEWEAHKVERVQRRPSGRIKESLYMGKDLYIDNIELYNEGEVADRATLYEDDGVYAEGDVDVLVTLRRGEEVRKDVWTALNCLGKVKGYSHSSARITADPYYSSPEETDFDKIEWFSCRGDRWDRAEYSNTVDDSLVLDEDYWEDVDNDEGVQLEISESVADFVDNYCTFRKKESRRMTEALTYKYRIVLDQPEGSNYRLTHSNILKFKTREEAEEKLEELKGRLSKDLESKGISLKVEEVVPKAGKKPEEDGDFENPFEVGDILYGEVGYSMIIPEWLEVIKTTAKTVTCKRLNDRVIEHDGYGQRGTKEPLKGSYYRSEATINGKRADDPVTLRVNKSSYNQSATDPKERYYASTGSRGSFKAYYLWDGQPKGFDYYD